MMRRLRISGVILLAVLVPTLLVAQPIPVTPLPPQIMTINHHVVPFESAFVGFQKLTYAPLRDLVKSIDARTSYLRGSDTFEVVVPSPSVTLVIAPNSTELSVNGIQRPFSGKTFFHEGQFYVPVEEFFKRVGFAVTPTKTGYIVEIPSRSVATSSAPFPGSVARGDLGLPAIPTGQSLSIGFGAKVYSLTGKYMMANGTVYADLESILSKEGIVMIRRPDYAELILGQKTIRFFAKNADIRIASGNQLEIRSVGHPLLIQQGTPYFALKSLAMGLEYGLVWDASSYRIQLLNRINQIVVTKKNGTASVLIGATHSVVGLLPVALERDHGFYVDLLDAQLGMPDGVIQSADPNVVRMEVYQFSPTRVRLKVILKSSVGYSSIQPNSSGGTIELGNRVTHISEHAGPGELIIRVAGIGTFSPKVWKLASPSVLVVDIPNSYSTLPMAIRPSPDAPFQSIRTSQFSVAPAVTRIAFDLPATATYSIRLVSPSQFEIIFPRNGRISTGSQSPSGNSKILTLAKPSLASASITVTHNSRVREQTIRKTPPVKPLARKIIVIDPGHGGSDPGSIGENTTYEKTITIDISRRLKKLLEEAGAVVLMCRNNDENPSLQDRSDMGNFNNADLFLSVHINSFFHPYASGTETYYYKPSDKPLSVAIHQEMVEALGFRDNGVKRARLYVLRNTRMPAVLVEPCFITNPLEFAKLSQPEIRQKIAKAVTDGTIRYVNETKGVGH
jgi:N-acetylmuramoyl-L-alanine amidase